MFATIVFDIGGVFLHHSEELLENMSRQLGLADPRILDQAMFGDELWNVYKRGGMTEAEYWSGLLSRLAPGFDGEWRSLSETFEFGVVADIELVALALRLKAEYPLHALSNAGAELERRLRHLGLDALFEHVINSHRVGMAKPDAAIFSYTAKTIGVDPPDILFVDDKPRNTRVAEAMGFSTHVFTSAAAFSRFLQRHGA